jgi:hypothetical protein
MSNTDVYKKTYNQSLQSNIILYLRNEVEANDQIYIAPILANINEMEGVHASILFTYVINTVVILRLGGYDLLGNYKKVENLVGLVFEEDSFMEPNLKLITNQLIAFAIMASSKDPAQDPMKQAAIEELSKMA